MATRRKKHVCHLCGARFDWPGQLDYHLHHGSCRPGLQPSKPNQKTPAA